jgi:hypothetical protein
LITICDNKWYLGTWRNLEKATRSYDWVAIQHLGEQAQCNFPTDWDVTHLLVPGDIRFATKADEKENRLAKAHLRGLEPKVDPEVTLIGAPSCVEHNLQMLSYSVGPYVVVCSWRGLYCTHEKPTSNIDNVDSSF